MAYVQQSLTRAEYRLFLVRARSSRLLAYQEGPHWRVPRISSQIGTTSRAIATSYTRRVGVARNHSGYPNGSSYSRSVAEVVAEPISAAIREEAYEAPCS